MNRKFSNYFVISTKWGFAKQSVDNFFVPLHCSL